MLVSNVFLLDGGPGDRWLVDTGHVAERMTLLLELRSAGLRPSDITGVLLTHRHSDHAGNAAYLQRRHGIRVYAHRADAEVLARRAHRPRLSRGAGSALAGVFAAIENVWPAASLEVDRALDDGDTVAGMEVHWMPGHTDGSVFFRHATTRSLLSGDTLLTAHPPLTLRAGLAMPYPSYATDIDRARASLRAFHDKGIAYDNLLAGHGPPIVGGAREQVLSMLAREGH
jgi:glyoxylase-like metal-dependent hydrolase (beta-lactamase superfamily II)